LLKDEDAHVRTFAVAALEKISRAGKPGGK
jgi:hypothetical protein